MKTLLSAPRLQRNGSSGNCGHSLLKAARRGEFREGIPRIRSNGQAFDLISLLGEGCLTSFDSRPCQHLSPQAR
jgi:hypothetical protein